MYLPKQLSFPSTLKDDLRYGCFDLSEDVASGRFLFRTGRLVCDCQCAALPLLRVGLIAKNGFDSREQGQPIGAAFFENAPTLIFHDI
jgi:hypothetical protein